MLVGSISNWWYPKNKSMLVKYLQLVYDAKISLIRGTMTTGKDQGDVDGSMMPLDNRWLISCSM
ncbi:hypothetical protein DSO57_1038239 [Entomophthora muscae]|uniref:Uncharacterized protein n=1 Tax=Entomophthora muscae TaxID=34485 RepID=A0ACC2SZC5_9FUNG|nr:hypothetical protein DSO57_1038239 [Entomophthora muscae]